MDPAEMRFFAGSPAREGLTTVLVDARYWRAELITFLGLGNPATRCHLLPNVSIRRLQILPGNHVKKKKKYVEVVPDNPFTPDSPPFRVNYL